MTFKEMSHKERVANGAALLDEHHPGWYDSINLDILDVSCCDRCICGQLAFKGFFAEAWGVMENAPGEETGIIGDSPQDYDKLTVEWTRVIRQKREDAKKTQKEKKKELVPA